VLFAYDNSSRSYVDYCRENCADPASWALLQVGIPELEAGNIVSYTTRTVAFANEAPEFMAVAAYQKTTTLAWFTCIDGDCAATANWISAPDIATGNDLTVFSSRLITSESGAPRLALHRTQLPSGTSGGNLTFVGCDGQCGSPSSWTEAAPSSLPADASSLGYDLAEDGSDHPYLSYVSDFELGYSHCEGDCTDPSAWTGSFKLAALALNAAYPFPLPGNCTMASWVFDTGPAVAVTPENKPALAFTASMRASGGNCPHDVDPLHKTISYLDYLGDQSFVIVPE
jgi:hypothetical protein